MISCFISNKIFYPIFVEDKIIIPYGLKPFDICQENPVLWNYIKITFIICYLLSNIIIINLIYVRFLSKFKIFQKKSKNIFKINNSFINKNNLNLLIGKNINNKKIFIPESGLYQNILITRNYWFWQN